MFALVGRVNTNNSQLNKVLVAAINRYFPCDFLGERGVVDCNGLFRQKSDGLLARLRRTRAYLDRSRSDMNAVVYSSPAPKSLGRP
jgi:hypothetical protein